MSQIVSNDHGEFCAEWVFLRKNDRKTSEIVSFVRVYSP